MQEVKIVSRFEVWPIGRLVPYIGNPRAHSAEQIRLLARSIRQNGFINPALVNQDGTIVAGHARILAAQLLGISQLPVIIVEHLSETELRGARIALNQIALQASWDEGALHAELAALLEAKIDLTTLGFDDAELKRLVEKLDSQIGQTDDDAVQDLPKQAVSTVGDLWILGDHRMLCGDSRILPNLETVLDGHLADLIYADPPYNVNYSDSPANAKPSRRILNDNLGSAFYKFLYEACVAMLTVSKGAVYISMASSELHTLYKAFTEAGGHWSTYVIWVKNAFTLGRSDYQRQFEPTLYGWKEGNEHVFCGGRNQGDVWFIDKPLVNDLHLTMKPVELVQRAILNSSEIGNLVLDPFGGSGTTLIACQKTSRRARLIELDPKYVDAALLRWEAFSGQQATLAASGKPFSEIALERQPRQMQFF